MHCVYVTYRSRTPTNFYSTQRRKNRGLILFLKIYITTIQDHCLTCSTSPTFLVLVASNVPDPDPDPNPRIRTSYYRILIFSSVTFKTKTEHLFCLLLFEGTFISFFSDKKSLRSYKSVTNSTIFA